MVKILLLDVETAPNLAHVWGLWQQNVGLPQLIDSGYTLCWSAKWLGEKPIFFSSIKSGKKAMIRAMHKLMSEADAICTYNGNRFDIPILNRDFLEIHLAPPPPSKSIDLLRVVKSNFRFPSNKLAYVAKQLGIGAKIEHSGHDLWMRCMAGDKAAWGIMETYNKQDVVLLEKLYERLRPWIRQHPNQGLYNIDSMVCPKCGSDRFKRKGERHTITCTYQRFQCCTCGGWFRGVRNVGPKPSHKFAPI